MVWVFKRTVSMRRSFEHPKHMLKLMGQNIFSIFTIKVFCLSDPCLCFSYSVFLTNRLHYIHGYHNPDATMGKEVYRGLNTSVDVLRPSQHIFSHTGILGRCLVFLG